MAARAARRAMRRRAQGTTGSSASQAIEDTEVAQPNRLSLDGDVFHLPLRDDIPNDDGSAGEVCTRVLLGAREK